MVPDLKRLASEYCYLRPATPFNAHDAVAIAVLRGRREQRAFVKAYLETAWRALVPGLALPNAEEAAAALGSQAGLVQSRLFERFEPMVFGNLLRARRSVLGLVNLNAGVIEGDPWGGPWFASRFGPLSMRREIGFLARAWTCCGD